MDTSVAIQLDDGKKGKNPIDSREYTDETTGISIIDSGELVSSTYKESMNQNKDSVKNLLENPELVFSFQKLEKINNEIQQLFGDYNKNKNELTILKDFKSGLENFIANSCDFLEVSLINIEKDVEKNYGKIQSDKISHHTSSLLTLIKGPIEFYIEYINSMKISDIEDIFSTQILEKQIRALIGVIMTCKSKRGCELFLQFINKYEKKYEESDGGNNKYMKVEDIMLKFYYEVI